MMVLETGKKLLKNFVNMKAVIHIRRPPKSWQQWLELGLMHTYINIQLKDDQKHHRCMFMELLHAIQFVSCQELLFRTHKEDTVFFFSCNLYQLLLLPAKDYPEITPWLHQKDYTYIPRNSNDYLLGGQIRATTFTLASLNCQTLKQKHFLAIKDVLIRCSLPIYQC